jgi:hypothetical protein
MSATSARSGSIRCEADLLLARLAIVSFARIVSGWLRALLFQLAKE